MVIQGSSLGLSKGDTRSLDHGSYGMVFLWQFELRSGDSVVVL